MDSHRPHEGQTTPDDAARAELLASLNELLEAERAGARVAMETGREIEAAELAGMVTQSDLVAALYRAQANSSHQLDGHKR